MAELISPEVLDALAPELITRIIGQVESNENGSYARHENGLQLCWNPSAAVPVSASPFTEQGLTIYAATLSWTFPAAFISPPAIGMPNARLLNAGATRGNHLNSGYAAGTTAGSVNLRFMCLGNFDAAENPYPIAIGRWK